MVYHHHRHIRYIKELVDIGFSNMQGTITSELAKLTNLSKYVVSKAAHTYV